MVSQRVLRFRLKARRSVLETMELGRSVKVVMKRGISSSRLKMLSKTKTHDEGEMVESCCCLSLNLALNTPLYST